MIDYKVVDLTLNHKHICFSIEPEIPSEKIDTREVNDIIEDTIASLGEQTLEAASEAVFFALSEQGYVVRDVPKDYETIVVDIEKIKVEDYER